MVVKAGGGSTLVGSAAGWTSRWPNDRAVYVGIKAHSHHRLPAHQRGWGMAILRCESGAGYRDYRADHAENL